MPESDLSAARARIETVERRLAALQDLGLDIAALRSQLALARNRLDQGGTADAEAACDAIADAIRRLASSGAPRTERRATVTPDKVADELRRMLSDGPAGDAIRAAIEDRLGAFERRVRDQFARELAQVIAARPWSRDLAGDPATKALAEAATAEAAAVRQELAALAEARAAEARARDEDLGALRAEVESLRAVGGDAAQLAELAELVARQETERIGRASEIAALRAELEALRTEIVATIERHAADHAAALRQELLALTGRDGGADAGTPEALVALQEELAAARADHAALAARMASAAPVDAAAVAALVAEAFAAEEERRRQAPEAVALRTELEALAGRIAALEATPASDPAPLRAEVDALAGRVAALAAAPPPDEAAIAVLVDRAIAASADHQALEGLHAEIDALRAAIARRQRRLPATGAIAAAVDRVLSAPEVHGPFAELRAEVTALRAQIEHPAADEVAIREVVEQVLAERPAAPAAPAEDPARTLVAEATALHARLGERLLGLEQRLAAALDRATPMPAIPLTRQTSLHVDIGPVARTPHRSDALAETAVPSDTAAPDWIFPTDDSGSKVAAAITASPTAQPEVTVVTAKLAIEKRAQPADASEAKTEPIAAGTPVQQEAVTLPVANPADHDRLPATPLDEALVRRLVEERLSAWVPPSANGELVGDDDELRRTLVRVLPEALADPAVRTGLFAAFALEATAHPTILAELSGLRTFLRRELQLAIDELKKELSAGV